MIRILDLLFSIVGLVVGGPLLLTLSIIGWFDTRSPLLFQQRVGRYERPFVLIKFRTMRPDAAVLPTHMADASAVTKYGKFIRKLKLDELPQLWNVLRGEMSLVGPRPSLFSQLDVVEARRLHGVLDHRPGITGLAQVRGIDMSQPELLANTDAEMLRKLTIGRYFGLIVRTVLGSGRGDRINPR